MEPRKDFDKISPMFKSDFAPRKWKSFRQIFLLPTHANSLLYKPRSKRLEITPHTFRQRKCIHFYSSSSSSCVYSCPYLFAFLRHLFMFAPIHSDRRNTPAYSSAKSVELGHEPSFSLGPVQVISDAMMLSLGPSSSWL